MKIEKTISIKEVAKARDRLIKLFEKEKKITYTQEELKYNTAEMLHENDMEWVIEEIQSALDFDGEEE